MWRFRTDLRTALEFAREGDHLLRASLVLSLRRRGGGERLAVWRPGWPPVARRLEIGRIIVVPRASGTGGPVGA